jgi:hypothetical protein
MTDQPQRPEEAGQTQPLGEPQPTEPQPTEPQPAAPQPAAAQPAYDPLAAPPAGVQQQPTLSPRKSGSSLPTSTLAMLGVALLVVGGVIGALIGHNVGTDDTQQAGRFTNGRGAYGFPGGGQGAGPQNQQGGPQSQQGQQGQGFAGRGLAAGTVTAVDGDTITVKQANGQTVKVKLTGDTQYTVTTKGSKDDVKVGQPIVVTGERGDDGTVSASSVRTGEEFLLNGRGPSAQGSSNGN